MTTRNPSRLLCAVALAALCAHARAQDPDAAPAAAVPTPQAVQAQPQTVGPSPGHSMLGEAFNEGPRQRATLMKGMANVRFPVTTKSPMAQKLFNQGVSQLHGFWYLEAERSFRQVLAIDPTCVMAYWGMAMANVNNERRAKEFITKAAEKKAALTERERLYIEAEHTYLMGPDADADRKKRHIARLQKLSEIMRKYPEDIEAKAFYAVIAWEYQWTAPLFMRGGMDYLMKQVLKENPMHPLHHYLIHLWDGPQARNALESAARCGQSSPGIAHMWHMPGHIFSDLQRYIDAAWQQEAGVRVDNAQLIRNRVMPDQIHNYAHNSEWLIRDLSNIGRVHDAIRLAKNMIEMPRHPKYNTIERGSTTSGYGRTRLLEVLARYEMWDDVIALSDSVYLEPTANEAEQVKRLQALGVAYFAKGEIANGEKQLAALQALQPEEPKQPAEPGTKVKTAPFNLTAALSEVRAYRALAQGKKEEALKEFEAVQYYPNERKALIRLQLGDAKTAADLARDAVNGRKNEVQPLAVYVEALYRAGNKEEAAKQLKQLQTLSGPVDVDAPVFRRISQIAPDLGFSADWRQVSPPAADTGKRPDLDTLGPFCWTPSPAPAWTLPDVNGRKVSLEDFRKKGRPLVVLFYLGKVCTGCMEQLNAFAPTAKEFEKAGISLVAVSTDSVTGLNETFSKSGEKGFPFPLLSDKELKVFKAYRAYDDFEKMALHGAFLIDRDGLVRWQDISFEPFKQPEFLLNEAKRLLQIPGKPEEQRIARQPAP